MSERKTMMEQAGISRSESDRIVRRSFQMERFVADVYGGELRVELDHADVNLPDFGPVDVKAVPTPRATFVNGGTKRPVVTAIVVSRTPRLVLGLVEPDQWEDGYPSVVGRKSQRCWHVRRAECFPPPPSAIRIGCVDPEWYAKSDDALLHTDWNDRNRRRSLRRRSAPIALPWADPESVAKGTGLAARRSHAPGAENYKRSRPR